MRIQKHTQISACAFVLRGYELEMRCSELGGSDKDAGDYNLRPYQGANEENDCYCYV